MSPTPHVDDVPDAGLVELLYQALETESGGIRLYTAAIDVALNDDLRSEWEEYLAQTIEHRDTLLEVLEAVGLDPEQETPGRTISAHLGQSLEGAIKLASAVADADAVERVAAECVVLAETLDHQHWALIGHYAERSTGPLAVLLRQAHQQVEREEDHHLFHTKGWARELWIKAIGLPAVLPPPEEVRQVETAAGAARAEQGRDALLPDEEA